MTAVSIVPADLAPFADIAQAKAQAMIADALAMAKLFAPCIVTSTFAYPDVALAIIRGAILRWNEAGSGVRTSASDTVGPFTFSESYQQPARRALFWPSEIEQLKKLCANSSSGKAWSYDTTAGMAFVHAEVCSLYFGSTDCSCGAVLSGFALWENDAD